MNIREERRNLSVCLQGVLFVRNYEDVAAQMIVRPSRASCHVSI